MQRHHGQGEALDLSAKGVGAWRPGSRREHVCTGEETSMSVRVIRVIPTGHGRQTQIPRERARKPHHRIQTLRGLLPFFCLDLFHLLLLLLLCAIVIVIVIGVGVGIASSDVSARPRHPQGSGGDACRVVHRGGAVRNDLEQSCDSLSRVQAPRNDGAETLRCRREGEQRRRG